MKRWIALFFLAFVAVNQLSAQCSPAFTYQADTNNFVIFTNLTPSNAAFSYQWDFGDGSPIDTSTNPTHQYNSSGGFIVTLSVDSGTINCGTYLDTIFVNFCTSNFSYQQNINFFQFQNYSAASSSSFHYWDFGDGNYSSQKNPSHTYQFTGQYAVVLNVYDSLSNCFSSNMDSVVVHSLPCEANFNYATNKDTLVIQNQANNFNLISYDFGDSTSSSLANPTHIYAQSGTYVVCQTVRDTLNNCIDTFCDTVNIYIPPPCQAGFSFSVNEDSLFVQNNALNYQVLSYDFGDGNSSTSENPIHVYSQRGTYQLCQTVEDTLNNCIDTFCDSVTISIPPPCEAGFTFQFQGDSTYFQNTATNYDSLIYFFGDGNSSTLENPIHQYFNSGEYVVEQRVFNHRNCISIFRDTILVTISTSCVAKFDLALDTTKPSTLYLVNNSSNDNSNQYFWDFGDGNTSTDKNPTHQYAENKVYPICLRVSDTVLNCMSIYCDTVGLDSNGNILKSPGFTLKVIDGAAIGLNEKDNPLKELQLYPNPADDIISIKWPPKVNEINYHIFNINGQIIGNGKLTREDRNAINVSQLPTGIYWIQINNEENQLIKKMIKQ